jgi:predicted RNA binding protein YcfA (HicA-like mRNA interferase family)
MTPRLPRDITGHQLTKSLSTFGYEITRQTGSHLRLTTSINGEHHMTVPAHDHLKIGYVFALHICSGYAMGGDARHPSRVLSRVGDRASNGRAS